MGDFVGATSAGGAKGVEAGGVSPRDFARPIPFPAMPYDKPNHEVDIDFPKKDTSSLGPVEQPSDLRGSKSSVGEKGVQAAGVSHSDFARPLPESGVKSEEPSRSYSVAEKGLTSGGASPRDFRRPDLESGVKKVEPTQKIEINPFKDSKAAQEAPPTNDKPGELKILNGDTKKISEALGPLKEKGVGFADNGKPTGSTQKVGEIPIGAPSNSVGAGLYV